MRHCQIDMSIGTVRIESKRALAAGARLFVPALFVKSDRQVVVRRGHIRLERQSLPKMRQRRVELPQIGQSKPEVAICLGDVGLEGQRLAVMNDGLVQSALRPQSIGEIIVRLDIVRIQSERLLVLRCRFDRSVQLLEHRAELVVSLGRVRLDGQCPVIAGQSLFQAPEIAQYVAAIA